MDDWDSFWSALALLVAALAAWDQWKRWRKHMRDHPPLTYEHAAGTAAWRWAEPPEDIGLEKLDTPEGSRLILPDRRPNDQIAALIIGGGLLAIGVWLLFDLFILRRSEGQLFGAALAFMLGAVMVDFQARLIAVELRPDRAVLTLRFCYFLTRNITYKAGSVRRFDGKVQSAFGQDRGQSRPYFFLSVERRLRSRKFVIACNPTQGSWMVGGLEHWRDSVDKP